MDVTRFPSKLLEEAVDEFAKLPGIGRRTALRLVLHLLKGNTADVVAFGNTIIRLKENIKKCNICNTISDDDICVICANPNRDRSVICVVENVRDVLAVESTHQFNGIYHVLDGLISPMDGIGPKDLEIDSLVEKASDSDVKEIILALSTTMEGDTTNFYIYRKLQGIDIKISTLARGVAIGDALEYADEITLGRSIINRTPYEGGSVSGK